MSSSRARWVLGPVLLVVVALLASACSDSTDQGHGQEELEELVIGTVLPETGELAAVGAPIIAGVDLAMADIAVAGGRVRLLKGDSGTNPETALETVNRHLGEGAQVILGAASSGVSQGIIQTLYEARIPQCSPSNGDPAFSTQANAEYYFRMIASSRTEAPVMAESLASRGATLVAIVARTDAYGSALADLLVEELEKYEVDAVILPYPPTNPNPEDLVSKVLDVGADSVGLIAFEEGIPILERLFENGFTGHQVHAGSGLLDPALPEKIGYDDPAVLDGLRSHAGAKADDAFEQRVKEIAEGEGWGSGAAYDCAVVLSLAYLAAGTASGPEFIAVVPGITRDGQKCYSYAQCADLLADGVDIDYDGISGPLELNEVGDATIMRLAISEIRDGKFEVVEETEITMEIPQ